MPVFDSKAPWRRRYLILKEIPGTVLRLEEAQSITSTRSVIARLGDRQAQRSGEMQLIDLISIETRGGQRRIELLVGDLSAIPDDHRVDMLVVSAFPGDYIPTPRSLIGSLFLKGLSIADLEIAPDIDT